MHSSHIGGLRSNANTYAITLRKETALYDFQAPVLQIYPTANVYFLLKPIQQKITKIHIKTNRIEYVNNKF
ncbi:hypothetical protein OESDEN_13411 [Oesophagostomum dentatum]|uniref:Uncharacterized protein n=1 Tax=Oesophagostomum dentatum TaxID=61180 RepID=A0A0B1SSF4_OESDE|nr:hypothetical protein OESDEN_13411 [Oesophagostomum dentatum]